MPDQVVFRGQGNKDSVDDGPVTPELHDDTEQGDLLVAAIVGTNSRTLTWSASGWTAVSGFSAEDPFLPGYWDNYALLWKYAGASESDPTFTPSTPGSDGSTYDTTARVFSYSGQPLGGSIPDLTVASGTWPGGTIPTVELSLAVGIIWARTAVLLSDTSGWDVIDWHTDRRHEHMSRDASAPTSATYPSRGGSTNAAYVQFCVRPPVQRALGWKVGML